MRVSKTLDIFFHRHDRAKESAYSESSPQILLGTSIDSQCTELMLISDQKRLENVTCVTFLTR